VRIFASTSVPFKPTTVQMLNLALFETGLQCMMFGMRFTACWKKFEQTSDQNPLTELGSSSNFSSSDERMELAAA
jgi:hypothetical protein